MTRFYAICAPVAEHALILGRGYTNRIGKSLRRLLKPIGLLVALGWSSGPARAQFIDRVITPSPQGSGDERGVTVASRIPPELTPPEVRLGAFQIDSTMSQSVGYDDNVTGFRPRRGSSFEETAAQLNVRPTWTRNSVYGTFSVDDTRYLDIPRQSGTTWSASMGGSLDIGHDSLIVAYNHTHDLQNSRQLNVPDLDKPIASDTDDGLLLYRAVFNRLTVQPGLEYSIYRYEDGMVSGVLYPQKYRDRNVFAPSALLRYEVYPLSSVVGIVQESIAKYLTNQPGNGILNYHDLTALGGYDTTLGDLWRVVALVGYEQRNFASSKIKTVGAPIGRLRVVWQPTGLSTITGTVTRQLEDTASDFTASTTVTRFELRIDHELRRNLRLHLSGQMQIDKLGGNTAELYGVETGADWRPNRYMALSAVYQLYVRQSSNGNSVVSIISDSVGNNAVQSNIENRIVLQLRLRF